MSTRREIILKSGLCPGDITVLTAAIRDLHRCYPGKFTTAYDTNCNGLFLHSPVMRAKGQLPHGKEFQTHYPAIHQSNQRRRHFIHGYIEYFNRKLQLAIKLTDFRPDLHLSEKEKREPYIKPPYWVLLAGGKKDYTAKLWDPACWRDVVMQMRNDGHRVVQVGHVSDKHQPDLRRPRTAVVDPVDHTLVSAEATPRVLPFPECQWAAPNVKQLVGMPVTGFRSSVQRTLTELQACTHLNDMLRGLAEVPALVAHL